MSVAQPASQPPSRAASEQLAEWHRDRGRGPAGPGGSGRPDKSAEGSWRDVIFGLLILLIVGVVVVKGCGALLAGPDARFELADCIVNPDGSVTVVGTVTNDGASGTVNVEPYAVVMGGERHTTGFMDFESGEIDSGETVRVERRIVLDSDEIPTGECGAEIL